MNDKPVKLEFIECDTCRVKPGSPQLCETCLKRRDLIEKYNETFSATPQDGGEAWIERFKEEVKSCRKACHDNYNGGHHERGENLIFHHGMDTSWNAATDWLIPFIRSEKAKSYEEGQEFVRRSVCLPELAKAEARGAQKLAEQIRDVVKGITHHASEKCRGCLVEKLLAVLPPKAADHKPEA